MCLAIPVQVSEILPNDMAKVSLDGVAKIVSTALVEDLQVGDYVVLHVGYALAKIDPDEAARTLELLAAMGAAAPTNPSSACAIISPAIRCRSPIRITGWAAGSTSKSRRNRLSTTTTPTACCRVRIAGDLNCRPGRDAP